MLRTIVLAAASATIFATSAPSDASSDPIQVVASNFVRAETDRYFVDMAARGRLGELYHERAIISVDDQIIIRLNRDTLYSQGVFDLAAGPLTVTIPEAEDDRYVAVQVVSQDHLTPTVLHEGTHEITEDMVGTRHAALLVRVFVDPDDPDDIAEAHRIQDAVRVEQDGTGSLELPEWDQASLDRVRNKLLDLAALGSGDGRRMGTREEIDPIEHLLATAAGWGLNPETEATYIAVFPEQADGSTVHELTLQDVPVDAFWSVSVYNEGGYFEPNDLGAYSVNSVTAERTADGAVEIQFGGCDVAGGVPNCLPITNGWNYLVRLYKPHEEVLDGTWTLDPAQPVN
jgi:hypothetical protein